MPDTTDRYIGARIAERRADRDLTQQGLAIRAHVSVSLLSKVECGQKPASPEFVAACARALGVTPADLIGQPYIGELRRDRVDQLIQPIREALNVHNIGHDPPVRPRSLGELSNERDRICTLIHETDLRTAAVELPALLREAVSVAHESNEPRAWALLVGFDRVAFNVTSKLGFHDLSLVAANCGEFAADRSDDPALVAMTRDVHAIACLRSGEFDTGKRLVALSARCLEDAREGIEREAAAGKLHLTSAILEVRSGNKSEAEHHFDLAERHAQQTGEATPERWLRAGPQAEPVPNDPIGFRDRGVHWVVFGPTNVAAHRIGALADHNEHAEALRIGQTLRIPKNWPPMRAGQIHIDMARSRLWTRQDDAAFRSLLQAQKVAPQQTRYHPQVRETVVQLRKRERSKRGSLTHFAEWVGV